MEAKRCILTGVELTPENDSDAHIIPNALGGRLAPSGLLSKEANNLLNEKFDLPLIKAYRPIMQLINGSRERGSTPAIEVHDDKGQAYLFEFDKPLRPLHPEVTFGGPEEGISIKARSKREARRILRSVVKKRITPDIIKRAIPAEVLNEMINEGVEQILNWGEPIPYSDNKRLKAGIRIGPGVSFPAAYSIVTIFAAHHGLQPASSFRNFVRSFEPLKGQLPPDTFYFMPKFPVFGTDAELAHQLVLIGTAKHKAVFGYVSLFGLEEVAVVLPYDGTSDIAHFYAVDVLTGLEMNAKNIEAARSTLPWRPTHPPGPGCEEALKERVMRVSEIAKKRARGG